MVIKKELKKRHYIYDMKKRYHCEFKNCKCNKFILHCNGLCLKCNHANIWHSLKEKPPTDGYLSFISPRLSARTPIYEKKYLNIEIFLPKVPPLPDSDCEIEYCDAIEILPV